MTTTTLAASEISYLADYGPTKTLSYLAQYESVDTQVVVILAKRGFEPTESLVVSLLATMTEFAGHFDLDDEIEAILVAA